MRGLKDLIKNNVLSLTIVILGITAIAFAAGYDRISKDELLLGTGTSADKKITFDVGDGSANPAIKSSSGSLEFATNGVDFLPFGSGSGGGGGINVLDNANFELGVLNWTASGGTFQEETGAADVGNGSKAVSWDPTGSQFLTSDTQTVPNIIAGEECVAEIYYKGGDSSYTLKAVQSGPTTLGSATLATQANYTRVSFEFTCPAAGSTFYMELEGSGAIIYLDDAFMGKKDLVRAEQNYVKNPDAKFSPTADLTIAASGFTVTQGTNPATFSDSYFILTGNATSGKTVDWDFKTLQQKDHNKGAFVTGRIQLTLDAGSTATYKVGIHDGTSYVSGTDVDLIDGAEAPLKALLIIDTAETYTLRIECTANCDADDVIWVDDLLVNTTPKGSEYVSTKGEAFATTVNLTTNIEYQGGFWYRRANRMVIEGFVEFSGANTEGTIQLQLPSGYNLDETLVDCNDSNQTGQSDYRTVGKWNGIVSSVSHSGAVVYSCDNDILYMALADESSGIANTSINHPFTISDGVIFSWQFEIPITEWADSHTNLLTDSIVGSNARFDAEVDSTSVAFGTYQVLNLTNLNVSGGMSYNAGTGELTLPSDGVYSFGAVGDWSFGTGASLCSREWWLGTPGSGTLLTRFEEPTGTPSGNTRRFGARSRSFSKGDIVTLVDACDGTGNSATGFGEYRDSAFFFKVADVSAGQPVGFGLASSDTAGLQYQHDVVEDALTGGDYTVTGSWASVGMSVDLTPGVWLLTYNLTWALGEAAVGPINVIMGSRLHNGTTWIEGTGMYFRLDWGAGVDSLTNTQTDSVTKILVVTSNTTYTVQAKDFSSGYDTTLIYDNGPTGTSDFEATTSIQAVRLRK